MLKRLHQIGLLPAWYKLKNLLVPDSEVVSIVSRNGAYEYLLRYKYACQKQRETETLKPIKESKYVWVCWFQGIENAPLLVQRCVDSIKRNNADKETILLTENNMGQYVDFPDYILQKYRAGKMTRTHFSDILRLHLLSRYGGVWIDSTILMTEHLPKYILDSPLFIYQTPSVIGHVCCATGFMASCAHHPIIEDTLAIINEYWKYENKLISYSVIHLAITMAVNSSEANMRMWKEMPLYYYADCEKLRIQLNAPYEATTWQEMCQISAIHKLTYKFAEYGIDINKKGTFYDVLINANKDG
ncbi:MAG: capsular polysaccharide synthesis protein [Paludibacteraceae bacterium]|nr:capsular polysaccharide synthesis protein [Paludibacteraceae bacterium]